MTYLPSSLLTLNRTVIGIRVGIVNSWLPAPRPSLIRIFSYGIVSLKTGSAIRFSPSVRYLTFFTPRIGLSRCSPADLAGVKLRSFPGISEVIILDCHPRLCDLLFCERSREKFARQRGQQRIGDDVIDHAAAGIGIGAF